MGIGSAKVPEPELTSWLEEMINAGDRTLISIAPWNLMAISDGQEQSEYRVQSYLVVYSFKQ